MSPALIADVLSHDNVVGLKQSESDLGQLVEVIHEVRVVRGLSRALFTGIDSQFAAAVAVGADGNFSTAVGIVPAAVVQLYWLAAGQDQGAAAQLQLELQPLNRFLEYDPGYVAPAKEALRMLKIDVGDPRAPLPTLTPDERARLAAALRAARRGRAGSESVHLTRGPPDSSRSGVRLLHNHSAVRAEDLPGGPA
jgi:dihydrodipicolinate synthase/N-acetylneuraminate lyase